tara:strand:- start:538 stop:693 length:156 start_codon:yes stop_codon:yes gene_type:complete
MTRKDYILIADTLKGNDWNIIEPIVYDLCTALKIDNRKFDKVRFIDWIKNK